MCPVIGLPPSAAAVQFNHAEVAPASATGVPGTPGTEGIDSVPEPGGNVLEPGAVVVPGEDGTDEGSPYASLFGDNVPALVTTFVVAALMSAVITCAGEDEVAAER